MFKRSVFIITFSFFVLVFSLSISPSLSLGASLFSSRYEQILFNVFGNQVLYSGLALLGVTVVWLLASASSCRQREEGSAIGPHQ